MAIMIPGKPLDYSKSSKEDLLFDILKKNLPDEWYVCHSFSIKYINENDESFEAEIDFLLIIPDFGCVLLESKAGQVDCQTGQGLRYEGKDTDYLWVYSRGETMKYNGPFNQLNRARRRFIEWLKCGNSTKLGYDTKLDLLGLVCFPSIDPYTIKCWNLPSDAGDKQYILSREDFFDHPEKLKDKILASAQRQIDVEYTNKGKVFKKLSKIDCEAFIRNAIAPRCNLVPSPRFFIDLQQGRLSSFLKDQIGILNYLEEQKIAVISGGAGTGKTMIALEKAIRLAAAGEKTLYLCYNAKLKEHLEKSYSDYPLIRFENIDSLYNHYLGTINDKNYNLLVDKIKNDKNFDFKNFLIDEAQDYGKKEIEGSNFLLELQIMAEERDGFCYYFYDKHQLVQSKEVPAVIEEADCKLTLFRNCRNTDKIAKSSCTLFKESEYKKKHIKGFEQGNDVIAICSEKDNNYQTLLKIFKEYRRKNYKDIVILTAKELETSSLSGLIKNEKINIEGYPCPITTCRKFKGLEAEAVILVDIDNSILLDDEKRLLFYVGASRAKFELGIIFNTTVQDAGEVMKRYGSSLPMLPNSYGTFFVFFNAVNGE